MGKCMKKNVIRITDKEIIKKKCFELLLIVREICEKNHIWYSLAYGTMLGAVRHQGYIPWDTDVDIYIYLPDKNAFRQAFSNSENSGIILDNFDEQPHNTHSHDIIRFEEISTKDVHLDIYYLVGAPSDYNEQRKFAKLTYVADHIIRSKHNRLRDCKKKNRPLVLCAKIIDYCFPDRVLKKYISKLESKYDFEKAEYVISIANWGKPDSCIPKKVFKEMNQQRFYEAEFAIPCEYDSYLRRTYGDDYMTPRRY